MKNKQILIIAAVAAVAIVGLLYLMFSSNPYTEYSTAFNNTTKAVSLGYKTTLTATIDSKIISATGNMKIKNLADKVNFINEMTIEGEKITQFSDGEFIYMDRGGEKTKFKIGEKPQAKDKGEFNLDYFAQEFSGLIDASKLKDIKIAEVLGENVIENITKTNEGSGVRYDVTLAPQLVTEIFTSVANEKVTSFVKPICTLNSFSYSALANASKMIESVTYNLDIDAVIPAELSKEGELKKNLKILLKLEILNPGQAVEFNIPDTSGY